MLKYSSNLNCRIPKKFVLGPLFKFTWPITPSLTNKSEDQNFDFPSLQSKRPNKLFDFLYSNTEIGKDAVDVITELVNLGSKDFD